MTNNKFLGWSSLVAIVLALFAILLVISGWGTQSFVLQEDDQDILSVSGQSEITVDPDKGEIFVKIETRNRDAQAAQADNRERSERVRQALLDAGVQPEEIETTQHSLRRVEEYNREKGGRGFKGYKQAHVMKLTTKNLGKIGQYIDAAVEAGANGIDHASFDLSKDEKKKVRNDALTRAPEEARSKAQTLADNLGVKLGNPVSIKESRSDHQPYRANVAMAEAKQQSDGVPATQVSPEKVTVTAGVSVDFRIY